MVAGVPPSPAPVVRTLLILVVGASLGYYLGYKDARTHDRSVVERALDGVAASSRGKYDSNVDKATESVDR